MKRILMGLTVSTALIAMLALPVQAQTGSWALGLHAGYMNPGDIAEGPQETLNFDETIGIGAGLDFWFGAARRWGLALEGTWTNWNEWDTNFGGDFGHPTQMLQYDAALQFRLATPSNDTRFLPFLSLGVGGVSVNPDDDLDSGFPAAFCDGGTGTSPEGGQTCDFTPADVRLDTDSHNEFAIVGGIGTDIFLSPSVALHLEAKDYWTNDSPYQRLSSTEFHDGGHNLLFNAGLSFYFGGLAVEEPGFVREEPEVVVQPEPEPEPEIVEETITICVVGEDGFKLQTVQAIRIPARNEVLVDRNGRRVAFATVYPTRTPLYVKNAPWYMNDQALVVDLDEDDVDVAVTERTRLEFVRFGSPARRATTDLVFVGTINGTPVYATPADVAPFRTRLETHLRTHTELDDIFEMEPELAVDFDEVNTLYVPVEPDCVFQPVSTTHFVRRTRG